MPDDESWNAFEQASAKDVQQSESFPDRCNDTITVKTLFPVTFSCRKTHMYGDNEHETLMNDETGQRQVRITWR